MEAIDFKPLEYHDEYRHPSANKDGGFANHDPDDVAKLRSTGKEYLKQIGKQIMSGKFNLFKISAPIKCMGAWSMINAIGTMACTAPFYMTRSALVVDPLERMKSLIAGQVSYQFPCHKFEKPLNPILGETYAGELQDGTEIYLEQTCHHPPITSCIQIGPNGLYTMDFYSSLSGYLSGWNSIHVAVTGRKRIRYRDGTEITWNNPSDDIVSCIWGQMAR